jgi:hypothetical protein
MFIPTQPSPEESPTYGPLPVVWTGADAPAASGEWLKAAIGSLYIQRVSATVARLHLKSGNAGAVADWSVAGSPTNATGKISIPLAEIREVSSSATINAAGNGGLLASDTSPILNTINGDTDSCWRLLWAAANVDPIAFQLAMPNDRDTSMPMYVKVHAAMAATTDTPVIDLDTFFDVGDTKVEDAIPAITGATYATYTATIAAADIPAAAVTMSCEMTPAAHGTDTLAIVAIWIEYTRI